MEIDAAIALVPVASVVADEKSMVIAGGLVPKLKTFFVGKDFVVVGMTRIPVVVQQVDRGVLVAVRTGVGLCGQTASTTSSS